MSGMFVATRVTVAGICTLRPVMSTTVRVCCAGLVGPGAGGVLLDEPHPVRAASPATNTIPSHAVRLLN
jgi:hypothetical protein